MKTSLNRHHLNTFWWFVCERQRIWHRRVRLGSPTPWTNDPVLQSERFTNVYRELDPGTQYAIRNILERDDTLPDRVFNVMLYRLIGRKETHAAIGFQRVDRFSGDYLRRVMRDIREAGDSPFTAAYMVSGYTAMGSRDKVENVARLFERIAGEFQEIAHGIDAAGSAEEVYEVVRSAPGFGDFLAYQILVDLLYPLETNGGRPLLLFSHDEWAKASPGARRGIRLLDAEQSIDDLTLM